jgi:hypothetical protein
VDIVLICEDWDASRHATGLYRRLKARLGEDFGVEPHPWDFSALTDPAFREMAAGEARGADMVIIAVHGQQALPAEVGEWVELWVGENRNSPALVVLFDVPAAPARGVISKYLEGVARKGGMRLFIEPAAPAVRVGGTQHQPEPEMAGTV